MYKERKVLVNHIYKELNKLLEIYAAWDLGNAECAKNCDDCKLSKWNCELDGSICSTLSILKEDVFKVGE